MFEVKELSVIEPIRVDPDRMVELCISLGEAGAERMIMRAMDDLGVGVGELEKIYAEFDWEAMVLKAHELEEVAKHVGMTTLSRVLGTVIDCLEQGDIVALSATFSRLLRISDRSLCAIMELQDLPG